MGDADFLQRGIRSLHLSAKKSSPTISTFTPSQILPEESPALDDDALTALPSCPTIEIRESPSVRKRKLELTPAVDSAQNSTQEAHSDEEHSPYDLAPPPPKVSHSNAEVLAERLFSSDHLEVILADQSRFHRFTSYLNRYRSASVPTLVAYLECQKALSAVHYANAVAAQIGEQVPRSRSSAATVDPAFESRSRGTLENLVGDALPSYITYRMVNLVTECLVKEITGSNAPVMRELVQGLAEVYCMTDPFLPDNPIVFASEEFYNTTQYGREYVIGRNCRFLQGPNTSKTAVARISDALKNGQEISEILLNYRRDGSPFLNLVMMAPLYDSHGTVRYFIGCQIDISNLIEGGRGLESFQRLLTKEPGLSATPPSDSLASKGSLKALGEMGRLLNDDEIAVLGKRVRRDSIDSERSTPSRPVTARRYVGMEGPSFLPPSHLGPSGRLPGVYQNYLLVRPWPSLRIIFTSASLRIPGVSQSRFLDRIGGPQHVREGVADALASSVGVTAKISWLTHVNPSDDHEVDGTSLEGKPRWIHCTPLLGSDAKVGVWMIVMVEKEDITGTLNSRSVSQASNLRPDTRYDWPFRGTGPAAASARFTSAKLYADYLKRQGKEEVPDGRRSRASKSRASGRGRRSDTALGTSSLEEG